jgi:hypothetical protein
MPAVALRAKVEFVAGFGLYRFNLDLNLNFNLNQPKTLNPKR